MRAGALNDYTDWGTARVASPDGDRRGASEAETELSIYGV